MINWEKSYRKINCFLILVLVVLISGCTSLKTNFNKKYREEWKKIIKSQAWNDALEYSNELASLDAENSFIKPSELLVVNVDYESIIAADARFNEKYNSLVSRAYFKIITEAQKADSRLKEAYVRLNTEKKESVNKNNPDYKERLALASKRYNAHRKMLEGLKGWNIFSENRTGDLEFFKKENINTVYKKHIAGDADDAIIGFLVYQLADLYHFEN